MKISVNYGELSTVLNFTNTVLSDKSVDDSMKNIIFMVKSNGEVKVAGYNAFTTARTLLNNVEVEGIPESGWEFQVKADGLNKIISSFSNLYKTKVDGLDFSVEGVRIKVTVHEKPLNEEEVRFAQDSEFMLESAPILANILNEIHREFPAECDGVTSDELLIYTDCLLPLLSNDAASKIGSNLYFADDYVFVINSVVSGFVQNRLPDSFKDLSLGYSSVVFLKKMCELAPTIDVSKSEKLLCIRAEGTEAFMRCKKPTIQYKTYIDRLKKDVGIVVDRFYLKDVLRRMGNISTDGTMRVSGEDLIVENNNFQQVIPLIKAKEEAEGVAFKVSISAITSAILGKDDIFKNDVFIYLIPKAHGYMLYMMDKSGAWLTVSQVTKN